MKYFSACIQSTSPNKQPTIIMSSQTDSTRRDQDITTSGQYNIKRTLSRAHSPSPSSSSSSPSHSNLATDSMEQRNPMSAASVPKSQFRPFQSFQSTQGSNFTIPSKEDYRFRSCSHPIEEICLATNYMAIIPDDFKQAMLRFICKEGLNGPGVYAEYSAPPNPETVNIINGKGGYFLKKTTQEANIYLIWYNRNRNVYMFWGALEKEVRDAMNRIRGRIVKYVSDSNSAEKSHEVFTPPTLINEMIDRLPPLLNRSNIAGSPPPPSTHLHVSRGGGNHTKTKLHRTIDQRREMRN